eukprot:2566902-Heterocapsa_arctica.AAC.1
MAFQGITRKEARTREVPEGDCVMKGESLDEQWKQCNEASEEYLGKVEQQPGQDFKDTGKHISFVRNIISAPQDNSEGFAITDDLRKQQ